MPPNWIKVSPRLKDGIKCVNSFSPQDFECLLKKVLDIQSKGNGFSSEELSRLQDSYNLKEENLPFVIQTVTYILKQASRIIMKPTELLKQLTEVLEFNKEIAEVFLNSWTAEAKDLFDLEKRHKLIDVSWEVDLQIATSFSHKELIPNAQIQFDLFSYSNNEKQNLVVELNENELYSLYNTIENIQTKLDSL